MHTKRVASKWSRLVLGVGVTAFVVGAWVLANEDYSGGTPSCLTCHGDFRLSPYTSLVDNQSWGNDMHDVHRNTMLDSDCDACHSAAGRLPTYLGSSAGGTGLAPISCAGCHGRAQDGTGTGSVGYAAGLRQRHWLANRTVAGYSTRSCVNCHSDSNPANKTVVGEAVKPPYYANPGTFHSAMPTDPCNPAPTYTENFKGTTIGLDNDGDGLFDMNDPNCAATTPGEASGLTSGQLLVTGYDRVSGGITITYAPACSATQNNIEVGDLTRTAMSSYNWSNRACNIGNTGTATFYPGLDAYFFIIVGRDASVEGSYGRASSGAERPESTTNVNCANVPQQLASRCD